MQSEKVFWGFPRTSINSKIPLPCISELCGQKHPISVSNSDSFHSFWHVLTLYWWCLCLPYIPLAVGTWCSVTRSRDDGTEGSRTTQPQSLGKQNRLQKATPERDLNGKPTLPRGLSGTKTLHTILAFFQGNAPVPPLGTQTIPTRSPPARGAHGERSLCSNGTAADNPVLCQ